MLKNLITGIFIGVANIIPGVSGGTIIVIFNCFEQLMDALANITKRNNPKRFKQILFLGELALGVFIGLISFAKIIDFLFFHYPIQTIYSFIGLILFSLPFIIKKELPATFSKTNNHNQLSFPFLILGLLIIISLISLNQMEQHNLTVVFPQLSFLCLSKHLLLGILVGSSFIFPGISGAMILLIFGKYHLYKAYLLNLFSFKLLIILPIIAIGIGILTGIILGAKIVNWSLNKYHAQTMSFIIGLIIASAIAIIPFHTNYTATIISTSLITFLGGGALIILLETLTQKKS